MPSVTGFASTSLLMQHFTKHNRWDFQYRNATEYLQKAKEFLEADLTVIGAEECTDSDGDIIRYSRRTNEFAVVVPPSTIRTYYKPMPHHIAPAGWPPRKIHYQPTNYDYFRNNCT